MDNLRFKAIRELLNMTQWDLAKTLNVSQAAITNWEKGNRKIPEDIQSKLQKMFNKKKDIPIYIAKGIHKIVDMNASEYGLFLIILLDKNMAKTGWTGRINVKKYYKENSFYKNLDFLKTNGFISDYRIENGYLYTSVLNRKKYILDAIEERIMSYLKSEV